MRIGWHWGIAATLAVAAASAAGRAEGPAPAAPRPTILAHDMPWFVARPVAPTWGWHWTMNAFDPDRGGPGRGPIASHLRPLIGPYDSSDPRVIEYHLLLMKLAGFDGLVVDWYGLSGLNDYPIIHRNTSARVEAATRLGLKVAICYEDQTIPKLVEGGKLAPSRRVGHARDEIAWLAEHWFKEPSYLKVDGRPVLLSFGQSGLTDGEWAEVLGDDPAGPLYLSEHRRRPAARGGFDWPVPGDYPGSVDRFAEASKGWPVAMPAAFPRFRDIYAEAKVGPSYGSIPDDGGRTYVDTLSRALKAGAAMVQVATWNDWGEGTSVEPSAEFGYRDLEATQRLRRELVDPAFAPEPADLRLPHRLFLLRQARGKGPGEDPALDAVAASIAAGKVAEARAALDRLAPAIRQ